MVNVFPKITKYSILILTFLLPLFFLPFSFEAFEFNKQYLLFFLVSVGFFCWLAKMVLKDKEVKFKRTPLDLPVLAFLLVAVLSAVFSVDAASSIFGFYGRFSDGIGGLLSLGDTLFFDYEQCQYKTQNSKLKTQKYNQNQKVRGNRSKRRKERK